MPRRDAPRAPGAARLHVIAHRGASAEAPENTLVAFRRALEIGVDGVELDAHLSADGVPVVIHDPLLERTTDGHGLVKDQPLAALRRLDAGRRFDERFAGERIPTLAEALEALRGVRVIVEIKNGPLYYPGIASRVLAAIAEVGHPSVTISSFDHPVLLEVKAAAPQVPTAVLYAARPIDPVRLARDAGAALLHPNWAYVTGEMVGQAHAAGLRVETWTVDEPAHLRHVIATGVDGVMTNHPDRLRAVLAELGRPLPEPIRR
jgi:glycerophosphoryl diester phosphodiesterase